MTTKRTLMARFAALTLVLTLQLPAQLWAGWNMYSREQEIQIGKEAAVEVEKQMPVLPENDPVSKYVRNLGNQLAANAPDKYPFTFKVVNMKEINAFALPGGPIYMHVGTIQAAKTEAELAGVMGHEIAHVTERHATENASKAGLINLGAAALGGLAGNSTLGNLANMGLQISGGLVSLKYGRSAESEADRVGARMIYKTGYNPQSMVDFFKMMESQGGRGGPQFLSSHPNPGNRAAAVAKAISGYKAKTYRGDSAEFTQIKKIVAGMKPLSAEEVAKKQSKIIPADIKPTDVTPSTTLTPLNHNLFKLSYPQNWEVQGDAQSAVTIAPKGGSSEGTVAYGVIVNGLGTKQGTSIDQAMNELVASIKQTNPEIQAVGKAEAIRVNKVDARSLDLIGPSPLQSGTKPERERNWLVALQRTDGSLIYLVFIAPDKDFDQLRPTYEKMLKSFHLTAK